MITHDETVSLATDLTVAWLSNPNSRFAAADVPGFLTRMHQAVVALSAPVPVTIEAERFNEPAVSVRKSLASPDHIISMIDGKPYRTLKRHLTALGLTPAEYRARYGLKADYPMVAPSYSAARRATALKLGLGNIAKEARAAKLKPDASPRRRKGVAAAKKAAKAHLGTEKN